MTVQEVAKVLKISRQRVHVLIKEDRIQATQAPCGCWDVDAVSLKDFQAKELRNKSRAIVADIIANDADPGCKTTADRLRDLVDKWGMEVVKVAIRSMSQNLLDIQDDQARYLYVNDLEAKLKRNGKKYIAEVAALGDLFK